VLRWSPDETTLAVTVGGALELIDVALGRRREILSAGRVTDVRWAPDGHAIYYLSQNGIHHFDLGSGTTRPVYRPSPPWSLEETSTFDLSRDGQSFAVAVRSTDIKCAARIVTLAGNVHDLRPFSGPCRAVAWTADEQSVLAGVHDPDGSIPVFMVRMYGGEPPVRLQSPRIQVVEIATSPDGSELLLGVGNPRPDVWTLSGFGAAPESGP
jgi:WD40 repeat protein